MYSGKSPFNPLVIIMIHMRTGNGINSGPLNSMDFWAECGQYEDVDEVSALLQ